MSIASSITPLTVSSVLSKVKDSVPESVLTVALYVFHSDITPKHFNFLARFSPFSKQMAALNPNFRIYVLEDNEWRYLTWRVGYITARDLCAKLAKKGIETKIVKGDYFDGDYRFRSNSANKLFNYVQHGLD